MSRNIYIKTLIPPEAIDELVEFKKELDKEFKWIMDDEVTRIELNQRINEFKQYLQEKYPEEDYLEFKLTGGMAYHETSWTLKDILQYHKRYCYEEHEEKQEYTRMEVNNMLFDLELEDVIGGYCNVAEPIVGLGYNSEIWDGTVTVDIRYGV